MTSRNCGLCCVAAVLPQKQYLLDGPVGCGKSVILAMLVHWARAKGWLVFYVPNGRSWTRDEYYFQNEQTGRWDTPVQAQTALEVGGCITGPWCPPLELL